MCLYFPNKLFITVAVNVLSRLHDGVCIFLSIGIAGRLKISERSYWEFFCPIFEWFDSVRQERSSGILSFFSVVLWIASNLISVFLLKIRFSLITRLRYSSTWFSEIQLFHHLFKILKYRFCIGSFLLFIAQDFYGTRLLLS